MSRVGTIDMNELEIRGKKQKNRSHDIYAVYVNLSQETISV